MKKHGNLYNTLCSYENLHSAYSKARRGKSRKEYVTNFEKNLKQELEILRRELISQTYEPRPLKKFIVRDPKTRTIHASAFRDRAVYHALVNVIEPIFEKIFIHDSFASRKNKGTHPAVKRFIYFMRKVSRNGRLVKNKSYTNNSIEGYVLKADIQHYFDSVDHAVLLSIIKKKIEDEKILWLIKVILNNFESPIQGKGMPLGNYTSQFFANVYLNELDYYVKHILHVKYYIRYVDDFVILHRSTKRLEYYYDCITRYLPYLKIKLHPDKSKITALKDGITFLGYRIFYHYKLLRKRNLRQFQREFRNFLDLCKEGFLRPDGLQKHLEGWFGYAQWANTYNLRKRIMADLKSGGRTASKIVIIVQVLQRNELKANKVFF